MPEFKYKAKAETGRTVSGHEIAFSREDVAVELGRRNLIVISIEEARKKKTFREVLSENKSNRGKVKLFELVLLCKQLSTMLHGGVPILNAIESIASEMKNPKFKKVLQDVVRDLREGNVLSESFKKHPEVFSLLFVSIVEAGEKVGALDHMLSRLSGYLESRERLTRKIRSATTYPVVIIIFFLLAITGITLFLIPRFQAIYEDFGAKLPPLTAVIFSISNFLIRNIVFVLIVLTAGTSSAIFFIKHTRKGKMLFDKLLLGLPIIGDAIKKAAVSKFCRTLSTLLEQGIAITEALLLVGKTAGNVIIEDASNKASKLIVEGEAIPDALAKTNIFPPLMLQMTSVGVESGALPELMDKIANFYEEQVDTFINNLTTMIEPILMVALGVVIAVTVVALYLPIFKLGTAAMGGG